MSDEPENLILVYLRRIDEKVDRLGVDMHDVKQRLTSLVRQVANLHTEIGHIHGDFAGQSARIDRIDLRLDRIERRLELAPA